MKFTSGFSLSERLLADLPFTVDWTLECEDKVVLTEPS